MLAASESGMAAETINATYADGSTGSGPVLVPAWWSWPYPTGGDLVFPYFLGNDSVDYNRSNIFHTVNWLDSSRELVSLTLPNVTGGKATEPGGESIGTRLHVFAMSVWEVEGGGGERPVLEVQYARSTRKWVDGSEKVQIVEVRVSNVGGEFVLRTHSVSLRVDAPGLETLLPAQIKRLAPGDQAVVEIGVRNKPGVEPGVQGVASVVALGHGVHGTNYTFDATYGIPDYEATYESIYAHESPSWYDNAKYGIFIHWGPYSVPGWGNSGENENYAEWYWWDLNQGPNTSVATYEHHLDTYGPNLVYDDFIQNFTADAWDPKEWVDLFADAGANYFVQVSKHHDGYALFDLPANVTKRTSLHMPPYRDLIKELFSAASTYQPHLHRAVYYSLPEWFHPDYSQYGFGSWPGGNATNPFTNTTLPYINYVPVTDYLTDKILPEMQTLATLGTEIMWCDIGGPNLTTEFAATWFNAAARQNRQVAMNARCGLPGDFDTPEYARYEAVQVRKWETSLGMDPYSYGYNRATPLARYMNASEIVRSLVDVVSKNGNFLLDIGPMADGRIPEVEQRHLREAGRWIREHKEAVFETRYWFVSPEEGEVRFTTTGDAFYVVSLVRPRGRLVLRYPVPWVEGDRVVVVGGDMHGSVVPSWRLGNGSLVLEVDKKVADADRYAWVFKIAY
ncbi:glycoside hydrolase [Aspergillus steynii IBT 23096]|uniref:alpha-L-fucosidase n=1 Tax=Aspergillus steynii IBT 23096 TaxID=1392250 RepID=A0A2I2FVB4_9EURO|nr:glycoside hydrolase [Aspergillus steynii IBT 23096]PLB44551.1 glycoside hydrolase [Aspergillus steynii IBT 23096]